MNFYQKHKNIIWLGTIILGAYLIYRAIRKSINPKLNQSKPLVVANNGYLEGGLKMANSLSNLDKLLQSNVDVIEINIQITADNVPILFRDTKLDDLTNGFGSVSMKTIDQIKALKYDAYPNEPIATFQEAVSLLKKYNNNSILYISNVNDAMISKMNQYGMFKGIENQILVKGAVGEKPVAVHNAGILYMTTIPFSFVGKMNSLSKVMELAERCKDSQFVRLQFNDKDSFVFNGKLSNVLMQRGCKLWVDALDSRLTIPEKYRGDAIGSWSLIALLKVGAIVTNKPLLLQSSIK